MAAPTSTNEVTARKLSASISALWAKIKSTFQTLGNLVTAWGSTPSDTKYPSEKLVKNALDGKLPLYKLGSEVPSSQDFVCVRIKADYVSGVNKSQVLLFDITSFADGTIVNNDGAYVGFKGFFIGGKPQGGDEAVCVKICAKIAYTQITTTMGYNTLKSDSIDCGPEVIKRTENGVDKYYLSIFYGATVYSGNCILVGQFLWRKPTSIDDYSYKNGLICEYTPNETYPAGEPYWNRLHTFTSNIHANTSTKLATARKLKTNLARTADSTFDGSADQTNIPVTGTLPVANGGTGKTSVTAGNYLVGNGTSALTEKSPNVAANNLINALSTGEATPTGEDYYVAQYAGGGSTTKTYHRRPVKALWEYIKAQISSVLGLTATSYGGNAATATALSAGADRTKLDGIAEGAEVNVQSDWNQATTTADDYIKNKPTLGTAAAKDVPASGNASTTQVVMGNDTRLTNARLTTGPKYYDLYNSGTAMYGWHIGSSNVPEASNDGFFKAVICISRWTQSNTDSKPEECFGYLDITHRNSNGSEEYYARIYAIGGVTTASNMGWAVMAIRGDSSKKIEWYVVRNPDNEAASGEVGINWGSISVIPMVNTGSSFTLDTSLAHMTSKWTAYLNYYKTKRAPYLTASQVGVGSDSEPVYVDNGQIKKCTGVQPSLSTQTAYASKGSATKVPQITTNSLGQVTGITEVTISGVTPAAHTHNTDANDVTNNTAGSDLSEVTDTTEIVTTNIGGYSSSDKKLYRRPLGTKVWPWIQSKLGISSGKGSSNTPVYFNSSGEAVQCNEMLRKDGTNAINNNDGTGTTATLMNELEYGTADISSGEAMIATTHAGGSQNSKWYRRSIKTIVPYIRNVFSVERSPASVGTGHKRIQLGYGGYTNDNVGYCCYLVHIYFSYVDDNLVGKGVTVLVNYDWRKTAYQSAKCQILNDNGLSAAGYNVVLANFKTDNNTNLHVTLGLVKNTAPTTLVGFAFSYCKIMRIAYGGDWTESVTSDNVGTYNYLIPATYFMETDTSYKIKVVTSLPSSPDSNTIYFV